MKRNIKARAGVAIGNMRLDGIRMQDIGKGRPKAKEARERMMNTEQAAKRLDGEVQHISDETYRERMARTRAATQKTPEEVERNQINDAVETVLDNLKKMGKWDTKAKSDYDKILSGDVETLKEHVLYELKNRDKMNMNNITDRVVNELMGGSRAAENQANAYRDILDNIKAGGRTGEPSGSFAAAARERMIDRQGGNDDTENGGHPDTGKDRANRRAYTKEGGTRKDSAEEAAPRNYAEARESAKAWANAGRR